VRAARHDAPAHTNHRGITVRKPVSIAAAQGRLAVLTPGLGAVATTVVAGVEAVKRGIAKPIGSLTQMGTVRLGKRTEARTPFIRDLLPLARLEDVRFGAWDVFADDAYESALHAQVLERPLLDALQEPLRALRPMEAVFFPEYVKRLHGTHVKRGPSKLDLVEQLRHDTAASSATRAATAR
jgi:myo-inositol-1-phosphate synthase